VILVGAQQNSNRRAITLGHHVLAIPTHIGIELTDIFLAEFCHFEFDQDMAFENAMVEHQIDEKMLVTDQNTFLDEIGRTAYPLLGDC
jgi:hypothetical protein